MFSEYVKFFKGNSENPLALKQQTNVTTLPQKYPDTDIYKYSREIKKIQKLNSNILSAWYEDTLHKSPRIEPHKIRRPTYFDLEKAMIEHDIINGK